MLDFLNSKTGIFAAIVGVMGLAGALWRFYVDITDRRAKSAEKKAADKRSGQGLAIADLQLSELSPSSNAYELQFLLTNTGTARLIMRALRLHVTARSEPERARDSYTMAPIKVYKHEVRLGPKEDVYDIRKRHFGRGNEPLAFDPGEASAFVVKLVSEELKQYSIHVEAAWYGAADPDKTGTTSSDTLTAEFPERISAGPLMGSPRSEDS